MKWIMTLFFTLSSVALADNAMILVTTTIDPLEDNDCWAELYSDENFKGRKLVLLGSQAVNDLDFPDDFNPMNRVRSVRTSETADIKLYSDEYQRDIAFSLEKGRKFPLIVNSPRYDDIDSVRLTCES